MSNPATTPIYLDNAATSFPKPDCVYDAVNRYMVNNGAAYGRGSYAAGDRSVQIVTECRQRLARLLGTASPTELAFTFNCTDSLNLILRGVLRRGDRVVTTTLEHNSVLRPLEQLKTELEIEVGYAPFEVGSGLVDMSQFELLLQDMPTRLVVVNHASNVTGIVQPVKDICQLAHAAGALVLVDAAQTTGHLPFRIDDLQADFVAAAGHKGLLGPLGTGLVYVRSGLEDQLRPIRCGGTGTKSESVFQPQQMPELFESGNLNMPGLAGLNAAVEWLLKQDLAEQHEQLTNTTNSLRDQLAAMDRITVHGKSSLPNAGIVSFVIDEVDSREAAMILDQSCGIQCRAGFHCAPLVHQALNTTANGGSIRLSPGLFTTNQQIETASKAIDQLCQSM